MADGVDAAVKPVQASGCHRSGHRAPRVAESSQLPGGYDPMPPSRQLGQSAMRSFLVPHSDTSDDRGGFSPAYWLISSLRASKPSAASGPEPGGPTSRTEAITFVPEP